MQDLEKVLLRMIVHDTYHIFVVDVDSKSKGSATECITWCKSILKGGLTAGLH